MNQLPSALVHRVPFFAQLALVALCIGCGPLAYDEPSEEGPAWVFPASIPTGYYNGAVGKTNNDLLVALSEIVVRGSRSLSYSAARDKMFADIEDQNRDDSVDCVYTGRIAKNVKSSSTAYSADINTEHTWPQSLGARGVAQSDLHHLWASDVDTNGRRSNYPFGTVKTVKWTAPNPDGIAPSKLGVDEAGRTVFEPHGNTKGDIARSIFYFYTRYFKNRPSDFSLSNFNVEEATLRRWHDFDPPDEAERVRNDQIYSIQGNRNPFVDHPEYLKQIADFPDR